MQNDFYELWCLLDWAVPGCLGERDHYKQYYAHAMQMGQRQDASTFELARVGVVDAYWKHVLKGGGYYGCDKSCCDSHGDSSCLVLGLTCADCCLVLVPTCDKDFEVHAGY